MRNGYYPTSQHQIDLLSLPRGSFSDEWFKKFVESYRCRICKVDLNLDSFGGLGPNHGIFCKGCYVVKN